MSNPLFNSGQYHCQNLQNSSQHVYEVPPKSLECPQNEISALQRSIPPPHFNMPPPLDQSQQYARPPPSDSQQRYMIPPPPLNKQPRYTTPPHPLTEPPRHPTPPHPLTEPPRHPTPPHPLTEPPRHPTPPHPLTEPPRHPTPPHHLTEPPRPPTFPNEPQRYTTSPLSGSQLYTRSSPGIHQSFITPSQVGQSVYPISHNFPIKPTISENHAMKQPSWNTHIPQGATPRSSGNFPDCLADSSERWLQNWIQNVHAMKNEPPGNLYSLKISQVQEDLLLFLKLLSELEGCHQELKTRKIDSKPISLVVQQAEKLKLDLYPLLKTLKDPYYAVAVKTIIDERRLKRKRHRSRQGVRKAEREDEKTKRQLKDSDIDKWRSCLISEEELKSQEDKIKKEADSILSEVKGKQEDAKRMSKLLQGLSQLRQARINKGEAHGIIASEKGDQLFHSIVGEVSKLIAEQSEQYLLEEKTLRVMMDQAPGQLFTKMTEVQTSPEKLQEEIAKILFGTQALSNGHKNYFLTSFLAAEESLEMLIQRRKEWDQFLFLENSAMSSSVPLGWVVPPTSPSVDWKNYQCHD